MRKKQFRILVMMGVVAILMALISPSRSQAKTRGQQQSHQFTTKKFTGILLKANVDIYLQQGKRLLVEGSSTDAGILDKLEVKVKDDRLEIRCEDRDLSNRLNRLRKSGHPVRFDVTMPVIENLSSLSSGNIFVDEPITAKDLNVSLLGSGMMRLADVTVKDDCEISLMGSGELRANEMVVREDADVKLMGSGDLVLKKLEVAGNTKISLMGSGDLNVGKLIHKKAKVSIAGSGNLNIEDVNDDNISFNKLGSGMLIIKDKQYGSAMSVRKSSTRIDISDGIKNALNVLESGDFNFDYFEEDGVVKLTLNDKEGGESFSLEASDDFVKFKCGGLSFYTNDKEKIKNIKESIKDARRLNSVSIQSRSNSVSIIVDEEEDN